MDSDVVKDKIVRFVVWTVLSFVISFLLTSASTKIESLVTPHEAIIEACVVRPDQLDVAGLQDVGGLKDIKEELHLALLLPLKYPKRFFVSRGPFACTRGVLLTGPPGCGKTMLMKAVAKTCHATFLCPQAGTHLQSKYYGESPKLLAAMFAVARKRAPCILFFDEVDAIFRTRTDDDAGADYQLKCEFLSLMDGLRTRSEDAVIVVGATNNPDALDPALKRRLPTVLSIAPPTATERKQIVTIACREESDPAASAAAFAKLADDASEGMSGSDLVEVYRVASRARIRGWMRKNGAKKNTSLPTSLPALTVDAWKDAVAAVRSAQAASSTQHCHTKSKLAQVLEALRGRSQA